MQMASSQLKLQLVPLLLLLLVVPCSHSKSCKCHEPSHDSREDDHYFSSSSLDASKATYRVVNESGFFYDVTRHELLEMADEARALVYVPHDDRFVKLVSVDDDNNGTYHVTAEASFTVSFTMSIFRQSRIKAAPAPAPATATNSLAFLILPDWGVVDWDDASNVSLKEQLSLGAGGSLVLSDCVPRSAAEVSVSIGRVPFLSEQRFSPGNRVLGVNITIGEPAASPNYTVWIEYDRLQHIFSVYVAAGEGKPKPDSAIASMEKVSFADTAYVFAEFGIFSTVGQFLQVHTWNFRIEGLPDIYAALRIKLIMLEIILPVFATILVVAGVLVAWYLRSKQRRWKKEQEKLAKTMRRLPGVPTQVDFADIRKATANFHETMKLGKGGFSSVYRCRLPSTAAAASSSSSSLRISAIDVAVKKFTREVEEQRYEDFLAEVSIINRLRHKNIVPLVGWSYNRGEPILIYEYMTNGSLDQHLFRRGTAAGQQQIETSIRQWDTRYSIARDIATGLHYVHHEHEPMVLHRDIKASNIMLDSNFHARLGDFGIACTVATDRSSVTGVAGTWGYIAPDYAMSNRATRQTDIYAFGVLILEVVTGKKNRDVPEDDGHISEWVWRLHGEGKLLEAVDDHQQGVVAEEAQRLLLLGLACTNPNPSSRPSMAEAVQVITKLTPPPDVPPERPAFVWPPKEVDSDESNLGVVELMQIIQDQPPLQTQSTMFFSV